MELDLQTNTLVSPHSNLLGHINNGLTNDRVEMPESCGLCGRTLSLEDENNSGLQSVNICDDCKFLLVEDFGTPAHNSLRRRVPGGRSINGSSEAIENFSQQFSQIINLARLTEPEHEDVHGDTDPNVMVLQPASSNTTPNGSSRWRRLFSDTGSEGFNSDSFYGESESNVSVGGHRIYHSDSDALSFSTYEGDSGVSIDGHTYFDIDLYVQSMDRSDVDSDTDIDPMHAGIVLWNSDEDEVEDGEWEEVDAEENTVSPREIGAHIDSNAGNDYFVEHSRTDSSEFEGMIRRRIREVRDLQIPSIPASMEVFGEAPYSGDPAGYLDSLVFEEFLDHLTETDNARRGAPPAAVSFIDKLPLVVITDEHLKSDGLACAICKDLLMIGTEVNQLPCFHLYHPSCILPWLSARNSCPLCRYELPTDDRDYERGKRHASHRMFISEIQQQEGRDDVSVATDTSEMGESQDFVAALGDVGPRAIFSHTNGRRGGWLFSAAAPIVGLAGIVLVLWLGNSLAGRSNGQTNSNGWPPQPIQPSGSGSRNEREKRWWWWF
ncbi:E3 ubiquitin-protein ligase Praja-2-like [Chenopodium quinoa]|uniref:RING-type E3 ubiquitin transferase n=1 Tax=Chenopodium quinoa TaxID=63459 RepID=A0A803L3L6_CHEQI|nr:E3 ubiquitin-protein ligase Praja-2-like [Chenopodium quinoa]XP_021767542.1 E3 ubiquitin-protein ligase Praja-2-like [Chenopodium quinoa]